MKNWKRIPAVITALILMTSLAACGQAAACETPVGLKYEDTIAWDTEYDVVVIGFGGAGAVSGIAAAEEGASVLLTEKAPEGHEGGNTRFCMQSILHIDDYDKGVAFVNALNRGFEHIGDDVVDFMVRGTMELPEWMDSVGLGPLVPEFPMGEYPEFPGADTITCYRVEDETITSGKTYWESVRRGVMRRPDNIDVWFESPAEHLIQDPGSKTILGVQIRRGGELLNVRARNGVVMACGGFEANEDMIEQYMQRERVYPIGSTYNTGDGVNMALEVGAALWHMAAMSGPQLTVKTADMEHAYLNGLMQNISSNGACIYVGRDGTRFMTDWGDNRHGHISYSGTFYSQVVPYPLYAIFDQTAVDAGLYVPETFSKDLSAEVASGVVVKADTIAELAEKIGVNVDAPTPNVAAPLTADLDLTYRMGGLVNQVERYNRYCAEGFDEQFDRRADTLHPISTPPYYALEIQPAFINTQGGAQRNVECEVLDPSGKPIPHLYSAGEFGSFFGGNYIGGGNVAETAFTGRVAGRNAALPKAEVPPMNLTVVASNLRDFGSDAAKDGAEISLGAGETMGTATGMGGDLSVKVKRDGDKIVSVEILCHSETAGISDRAIEELPGAIVAANSPDVDTVSGATITSNAIIAAVKKAIA